jgi:hypothetical protein
MRDPRRHPTIDHLKKYLFSSAFVDGIILFGADSDNLPPAAFLGGIEGQLF